MNDSYSHIVLKLIQNSQFVGMYQKSQKKFMIWNMGLKMRAFMQKIQKKTNVG